MSKKRISVIFMILTSWVCQGAKFTRSVTGHIKLMTKETTLSLLFLVSCAVLLAGCGSVGPTYSTIRTTLPPLASNRDRIYFYNLGYVTADPNYVDIILNGNDIGPLYYGGVFYVDRPAGKYEVQTDFGRSDGQHGVTFTLNRGQTRYIQITDEYVQVGKRVNNTIFMIRHVYSKLVSNDVAQKQITDCIYSGNK